MGEQREDQNISVVNLHYTKQTALQQTHARFADLLLPSVEAPSSGKVINVFYKPCASGSWFFIPP